MDAPGTLRVPYCVRGDSRLAGGHADASAIEAALSGLPVTPAPAATSVDAAVLAAAVGAGTLLSNDLALGRGARNAGVRWFRTADLVVLAHRLRRLHLDDSRAVVQALRDSGRLTSNLAEDYLEELS
jgi:hypothetical protein